MDDKQMVAETVTSDFHNDPTKSLSRTVLILAVIIICFLGIFNRDLWTPDEPRVAAISLEMSRNGNLIIPHLAGRPFIEKPPLYFAVAAGLIHTIGSIVGNTGAIRFTSTLFALATLLVSFLLAKRLNGKSFAFLSLIILGTMAGFVENFHWIRVDPALSFFVVAALWCFAEGYLGGRARFLTLAGLFGAGAFLSKGLIGPILIALPWTGLFFIWLRKRGKAGQKKDFFITEHLFGIFIFIFITGLWIILLKMTGSPELWHEWFWVNQVGRLTGTADLGHLRPGQPFYYITTLALYSTPWLPLVIVWFVRVCKSSWRKQAVSSENLFFLLWGLGTILFLSLSVTKRSIYLYPALPVFAMMGAMVLKQGLTRWFKIYVTAWTLICAAIMALITILPLASGLFQAYVPERVFGCLSAFGVDNLIAGMAFIYCLYLILKRRKIDPVFRFTAVTVMIYIVAFTGPLLAVDRAKSMQAGMEAFAEHIATGKRDRVAGWNFSETMLANFYYYCDWSVPQIESEEHLQTILQHKDDKYDTIIINKTRSLKNLLKSPYHVIAEGNPRHSRKSKRHIYWVEGIDFTGK